MGADRWAWRHEFDGQRAPLTVDADNRVVLLGTAGGSNAKANRCGYANAVVVGEAVYLVDCGEGVHRQLWRAGLTVNPRFGHGTRPLVTTVCITHLHADHVMDVNNLLQGSWPSTPIHIFGPAAGGAPFTTWDDPVHPVAFAEAPAPGTRAMIDHLNRAFATNTNARMIAESRPSYLDQVHIHEIGAAAEMASPEDGDIAVDVDVPRHDLDFVVPKMEPFVVQPEDDHGVTISAIFTQHAPVFPALAYRFDTPTGSVVFSGDTGPCDNVVTLAAGADVLVHEVIDLDALLARIVKAPNFERVAAQLARSHTPVSAVGSIAQRAGVTTLVLSHLVPGEDTHSLDQWQRLAQPGFDGTVVCGLDLDEFALDQSVNAR